MSDQTPTVRESMQFVAQASTPGSYAARTVHGCSCLALGHGEVWCPGKPEDWWIACLGFSCPAHGVLLERMVQAEHGLFSVPPSAPAPEVVGRTLRMRVHDAVSGFINGWRGAR